MRLNEKKMGESIDMYYRELVADGGTPEKYPEDKSVSGSYPAVLKHLAWCCTMTKTFLDKKEHDMAVLWFGFIQSGLWVTGEFTIEELRQHNVEIFE